MRKTTYLILGIVLLWAVFLVPGYVLASQQQEERQAADTNQKPDMAVPDLSKIIPLSANLSGLFTRLKNNLEVSDDFSAVEKEYAAIGADLEILTGEFDQLKETGAYNYSKIFVFRQTIASKKARLVNINKPLTGEINYSNVFKHIYDKVYRGILGMEHGKSQGGKEGEEKLIEAYRSVDVR